MKTIRYIKALFALRPVVIDGLLYVCIAMFLAMEATFSSDDAYKYVNSHFIFWAKAFVGWLGAGAGALKMFRSTTYSDHLKSQQDKQSVTTSVITEDTHKETIVPSGVKESVAPIIPAGIQPYK